MRLVLWNLINAVMLWTSGCIALSAGAKVKRRANLLDDELSIYTNHQHIDDYDIVSPIILQDTSPGRHKRNIDSLPADDSKREVKFNAFGDDYHIQLRRNVWLQRQALTIDRLGEDGVIRRERVADGKCHYHGHLLSHEGESNGAISTCNGLRGVISHANQDLFIEPLKQHHVTRVRRDANIPHDEDLHIVFKRSVPDLQSTAPKERAEPEFCASEDAISANSEVGNHTRGAPAAVMAPVEDVYVGQRYMEFLVMVDKSMAAFHGDDVINYTMTLMNIVSRRFAEPTLGVSMRLSITKFLLLETDTPVMPSIAGHNITLNVQANGPQLLEEFCRWQAGFNPLNDAHPEHWDIATLITRKNLFKVSGTYHDTNLLGRAYIGTACQRSLQCSVNQDDGLTTGSVIAHETGHNLNLHHDPDYGCYNGHHVMSSARPVGVESFKWSTCSSLYIKRYLNSRMSSCLNDAPAIEDPEVELMPVDDLPGLRYDLAAQCHLAYGYSSRVCSQTLCGSLGCEENGFCHYAGIMVMEGTTCGPQKWCVGGECVSSAAGLPGPLDGGWSAWDPQFSACSKSCGTGVRVRKRYCNNPLPMYGGLACPGDGREVRLCNMMPCDNITSDEDKHQQCAATNRYQFNNQYYTWRAFLSSMLKGDSVCKLQCISNANFYALRDPGAYSDGTLCWHDETEEGALTKACVDGLCREFGCDGTMDSGRVKDVCGKCDGSGRTCKRHTGRIRNVGAVHDFKTFLKIPVNSTGIRIINQNLRYTHMSIEANGEVVFRGEMFIPPLSQRYSHSGMVIKYLADAFRNKETIWVLSGPTSGVLEVSVILLHNPRFLGSRVKPDITWEYYAPVQDQIIYYWRHEVASGCSATCGGGVKTRRVFCIEEVGGDAAEVSDLFCHAATRPAEQRSCHTQPCPTPVWVPGQWSECSSSCGFGMRKRPVECALNTTGELMPGACTPGQKPATQETCRLQHCPVPPATRAPTSTFNWYPSTKSTSRSSTVSTSELDDRSIATSSFHPDTTAISDSSSVPSHSSSVPSQQINDTHGLSNLHDILDSITSVFEDYGDDVDSQSTVLPSSTATAKRHSENNDFEPMVDIFYDGRTSTSPTTISPIPSFSREKSSESAGYFATSTSPSLNTLSSSISATGTTANSQQTTVNKEATTAKLSTPVTSNTLISLLSSLPSLASTASTSSPSSAPLASSSSSSSLSSPSPSATNSLFSSPDDDVNGNETPIHEHDFPSNLAALESSSPSSSHACTLRHPVTKMDYHAILCACLVFAFSITS